MECKCETCLYKKNCQFLAKHKKAEVAECTAYENAAEYTRVVHGKIKWVNRPIHAQYATVKDEHGETMCVKLHDAIEHNPVGYCSECGKRLDDTFMHYCPNCGAKMDMEE